MGQLHATFCTIKVLGKIIDARGLDICLSIVAIYDTQQ